PTALLLVASDGQRAILVSGPASAIAFRTHSHDALIADTYGRITIVSNLDTAPAYQVVTDAPGTTVGVGFSRDGRRVFAADIEGTIASYDLTSGDSSRISCSCVPTGLHPMQGESVFRLNEPSQTPLLLFESA